METGDKSGNFGRGRIGEKSPKGNVGGGLRFTVYEEEVACVDGKTASNAKREPIFIFFVLLDRLILLNTRMKQR